MTDTGRVKHVSASQISTFLDCPRKWYLNKIVGLDSPSSAATELGGDVHTQLEAYLRGEGGPDDSEAGVIASQGLRYLPDPSPNLYIESALHEDFPLDAPAPVLGYIDVFVPSVAGSRAEIIDHKTTSSKRWAKSEEELKTNVQLMLYAAAILRADAHLSDIRLTHIYYGTKDRFSSRVSIVVTREHVEHEYTHICTIIERMIEASKADTAFDVYAERDACSKYGGCPFQLACLKSKQQVPKGEKDMTPEQRRAKLGLSQRNTNDQMDSVPSQKKKTQSQSQPQKSTSNVLYIGCMPIGGASHPIFATKAYADEIEELCDTFKVPHLGMVEYSKGWSALIGRVLEVGWKGGALYLDPESREYQYLCAPLSQLADVVIKRV